MQDAASSVTATLRRLGWSGYLFGNVLTGWGIVRSFVVSRGAPRRITPPGHRRQQCAGEPAMDLPDNFEIIGRPLLFADCVEAAPNRYCLLFLTTTVLYMEFLVGFSVVSPMILECREGMKREGKVERNSARVLQAEP